MFFCRSWASHHSEDGDPRLHASSHPGDAGELRRSGEWSLRQPAQWCTPRQLQPQSVPELCPKQSTHTITVVTVHRFKFSWCSPSPPSAAWWGGAKEERLDPEHGGPGQPPPLLPHKTSPPDLLSLTLELTPRVWGGKAKTGQGNFDASKRPHCKHCWWLVLLHPSLRLVERNWDVLETCKSRMRHCGTNRNKENTNTRHFSVELWGRLQGWGLWKDSHPQRLFLSSLKKTDFIQRIYNYI